MDEMPLLCDPLGGIEVLNASRKEMVLKDICATGLWWAWITPIRT